MLLPYDAFGGAFQVLDRVHPQLCMGNRPVARTPVRLVVQIEDFGAHPMENYWHTLQSLEALMDQTKSHTCLIRYIR